METQLLQQQRKPFQASCRQLILRVRTPPAPADYNSQQPFRDPPEQKFEAGRKGVRDGLVPARMLGSRARGGVRGAASRLPRISEAPAPFLQVACLGMPGRAR